MLIGPAETQHYDESERAGTCFVFVIFQRTSTRKNNHNVQKMRQEIGEDGSTTHFACRTISKSTDSWTALKELRFFSSTWYDENITRKCNKEDNRTWANERTNEHVNTTHRWRHHSRSSYLKTWEKDRLKRENSCKNGQACRFPVLRTSTSHISLFLVPSKAEYSQTSHSSDVWWQNIHSTSMVLADQEDLYVYDIRRPSRVYNLFIVAYQQSPEIQSRVVCMIDCRISTISWDPVVVIIHKIDVAKITTKHKHAPKRKWRE